MYAVTRMFGLLVAVAVIVLLGAEFGPFVGMGLGFVFLFLLLLFIPERWL